MTGRSRWAVAICSVAILMITVSCSWSPARRPLPSPAPGPDGARAPAPDVALDVANIVREQTGHHDVAAVVLGNVVLVALDAPPGAEVPKTRSGQPRLKPAPAPPPGGKPRGVTADPVVIGPLDPDIGNAVRARYPYLQRVLATDDSQHVGAIATAARDVHLGKSIDDRLPELARIAQMIRDDDLNR